MILRGRAGGPGRSVSVRSPLAITLNMSTIIVSSSRSRLPT